MNDSLSVCRFVKNIRPKVLFVLITTLRLGVCKNNKAQTHMRCLSSACFQTKWLHCPFKCRTIPSTFNSRFWMSAAVNWILIQFELDWVRKACLRKSILENDSIWWMSRKSHTNIYGNALYESFQANRFNWFEFRLLCTRERMQLEESLSWTCRNASWSEGHDRGA